MNIYFSHLFCLLLYKEEEEIYLAQTQMHLITSIQQKLLSRVARKPC